MCFTRSDADEVLQCAAKGDSLLAAIVLKSGLSEEALLRYIAEELDYPFFENLEQYQPKNGFLSKFPAKILLERPKSRILNDANENQALKEHVENMESTMENSAN